MSSLARDANETPRLELAVTGPHASVSSSATDPVGTLRRAACSDERRWPRIRGVHEGNRIERAGGVYPDPTPGSQRACVRFHAPRLPSRVPCVCAVGREHAGTLAGGGENAPNERRVALKPSLRKTCQVGGISRCRPAGEPACLPDAAYPDARSCLTPLQRSRAPKCCSRCSRAIEEIAR